MPSGQRSRRASVRATDERPVATDARIPSLTGLRGLAAFAVFAFHAWQFAGSAPVGAGVPVLGPAVEWLLRIGWSGVDVFFTLSAFLLALPYARAATLGSGRPPWRAYLRRRFARIFPSYWAQLAIVLVAAAAGASWGSTVPAWPGWGAAAAHVVLWLDAWPRIDPMLGHWWTLPVEWGFYLVLPLLAYALAPRRWPWLLCLVGLAWAWRAAWLLHPRADFAHFAWINQLPGRIDQFAIGMLAALAWVRLQARGRSLAPRHADALLVMSVAAFVAMPALLLLDGRPTVTQAASLHPAVVAWHGLASVAVAGVLFACASGAPLAGRILAARPVHWLGEVSYSLYLWHYPVVLWMQWQSGGRVAPTDFWPFLSACLLLSLALATASWWFVERPAQAWAKRR
jgi:peptidoglycan/LPS O-acetylase OafA/YrhL